MTNAQLNPQPIHPNDVPTIPETNVVKAILSMAYNKSAGLGGFKASTVQNMLKASKAPGASPDLKAFPSHVAWLINAINKGQLDRDTIYPLLTSTRGIVLTKKITLMRPLGISCFFTSLAAQLLRATKTATEVMRKAVHLSDMSHAGVKGGGESIPAIITAMTYLHLDWIVAQVDFENAFGSIKRSAVLELAVRTPVFGPLINMLYGHVTTIFYPGDHYIQTDQGVTQGCGIGGFCFSAVFTWALRDVENNIPDNCMLFRYADDLYILGPPAVIFPLLERVRLAAAPVGLKFQPSKSAIYVPAGVAAADRLFIATKASEVNMPIVTGIIACGAAVGDDAYITAYLIKALASDCKSIDDLKQYATSGVDTARQDSMCMMHYCVAPAIFNFLLRTHPPRLLMPLLGQMDKNIEQAVLTIIDGPLVDPDPDHPELYVHAMERIHLDLSSGGTGFLRLEGIAHFAYLGAIALAASNLKMLLTLFPTVANIDPKMAFHEAQALLQQGVANGGNVTSMTQLYTRKPTLKLQQKLTYNGRKTRFMKVYDSAPNDMIRALMTSQNCSESTAHLLVVPGSDPDLTFTNSQFATSTCQLVGLPCTNIIGGNNPIPHIAPHDHQFLGFKCTGCSDDAVVCDDFAQHSFSCEHAKGARSTRHRITAEVVETNLSKHVAHPGGNVRVNHEPFLNANGFVEILPVPARLVGKIVRADTRIKFPNGKVTLLDYTVTYVRASNNGGLGAAVNVPAHCATVAMTNKQKDYDARWTNPPANANTVSLMMVGLESTGRIHPDFLVFLRSYFKACYPTKSPADKRNYATALRQTRAGISVALRKNLADTINLFERRARDKLVPVYAALHLAGAAAPGGGGAA